MIFNSRRAARATRAATCDDGQLYRALSSRPTANVSDTRGYSGFSRATDLQESAEKRTRRVTREKLHITSTDDLEAYREDSASDPFAPGSRTSAPTRVLASVARKRTRRPRYYGAITARRDFGAARSTLREEGEKYG